MSNYSPISSPPRKTQFDFSKSLPSQSYDQFQASRTERMNAISGDIKAKKEQELQQLQGRLQELILKINTSQSILASEERDFLNEKEALLTELKRINIDAESRAAESRMKHLNELEALQKEHEEELRQFAESLSQMKPPEDDNTENPELERMRDQLKQSQNKLNQMRKTRIQEPQEPEDIKLYKSRITELESQKRDLVHVLKDEEAINKSRITEMTIMLDEQDTQFQLEIQRIQDEMHRKEEQYQKELQKMFGDLDRTQEQRNIAVARKKEKIAEVQAQIEQIEAEFKDKLRQANRVAEKLKTALVNANVRKAQQLEAERRRAEEQQGLLRESFAAQQRVGKLRAELEKEKRQAAVLRQELSAKIGPRRTASLYANA